MTNLLVAMHAITGILAIFAFLFVFIELLDPREKTIKRIQVFAYIGTILIFISWIVGGYYYVNYYSPNVKPLIKQGSTPWIHSVIMETKEHVFLFLPVLSITLMLMLVWLGKDETFFENSKIKNSIISLAVLALAMIFINFFFGALVSYAANSIGGE